jgi:hypothetical protein
MSMNENLKNSGQSIFNFAIWFLRVAIFIYIVFNYYGRILHFKLHSEYFWLALIYILCVSFIVIGDFVKNPYFTTIPAFVFFIASLAHLIGYIVKYNAFTGSSSALLVFMAIALLFASGYKIKQ